MKKWEYLSYDEKLSIETLNDLGSKSWELISHSETTFNGRTHHCYIFKRELNYNFNTVNKFSYGKL